MPPGDILITFNVKPDEHWSRDGLDLIVHAPVNIAQATLGSKVSVETLDEKTVSIKIPAGTPGGKRFRVRGQGIAKDGKRGDLLVEVSVTVPEKLNEKQAQLMVSSPRPRGSRCKRSHAPRIAVLRSCGHPLTAASDQPVPGVTKV